MFSHFFKNEKRWWRGGGGRLNVGYYQSLLLYIVHVFLLSTARLSRNVRPADVTCYQSIPLYAIGGANTFRGASCVIYYYFQLCICLMLLFRFNNFKNKFLFLILLIQRDELFSTVIQCTVQ